MTTENALQVIDITPLPVEAIKKQIKAVQELLRSVMIEDTHFGKIPGCGDKKALLKPGAEKICMMFRWVPKYHVTMRDLGEGHREYEVITSLHDPRGNLIGQGVGLCSTMEKKYRWRDGAAKSTGEPLPEQYWTLRNAKKNAEARELIGGKGFTHVKDEELGLWFIGEVVARVPNPDIADTHNTVLKIAKKRSIVDATITCSSAGDIFTQDRIDLDEGEEDQVARVDAKTTVLKSKASATQQDGIYVYKIDKNDIDMRNKIKAAGGKWNRDKFQWECPKPVPELENDAPDAESEAAGQEKTDA